MVNRLQMPHWSMLVPISSLAGVATLMVFGSGPLPGLLVPLAAILLLATVIAAVHHAETIAHRLDDPYGSVLLALAVTIIEVTLIASGCSRHRPVPVKSPATRCLQPS